MNQHASVRRSLIERAAEAFDLAAAIGRAPASPPMREPEQVAAPTQPQPDSVRQPEAGLPRVTIDRARLAAAGFVSPEAPTGGLAEEFRIVKRQLLLGVRGVAIPEEKRRAILVCSASPNEGKTFCAVNLALSMAGETDLEVLLVDGDFNKPEIPAILGVDAGPGLIDAIADLGADPEALVVRTDVPGLSILPAGRQVNNATELLASDRTRDLLVQLTGRRSRRIVIFDSPPALMASPASVLAPLVGQALMVVRADHTTEAELREALGLLSGCPNVSLLLNAAAFAVSVRRFGSYHGYEQ